MEFKFQKDLADYQLVLGAIIGLAIALFFQKDNLWVMVALLAVLVNDDYEKRFKKYENRLKKSSG